MLGFEYFISVPFKLGEMHRLVSFQGPCSYFVLGLFYYGCVLLLHKDGRLFSRHVKKVCLVL